jgi:hypothetical protein
VESFSPQLRAGNVPPHKDNTADLDTFTKLATRSSVMMTELRRSWYMLDTNDIRSLPRYIRLSSNIWADSLSRKLNHDDWHPYVHLHTYSGRGARTLWTVLRP